tara:strand:+ start:2234 stop:3034 length:801 start_codon:yes stop_codon:yes gene_type:complete
MCLGTWLIFASNLIAPLTAKGETNEDITQSSFAEETTGIHPARTLQVSGGVVLQSSLSESWSANLNVHYETYSGLPTDISLGVNYISSGGFKQDLLDFDLMQTVKVLGQGVEIAVTADYTDNSSFVQFGIGKSSAVGIGILDTYLETDKASLRGFLGIVRAQDRSVTGTVSRISGSESYTYTAPQLSLSGKHRAESGTLLTADLRYRVSIEDTSYTYTTFETTLSFPVTKKLSTQLMFGITHYGSPPISSGDNNDLKSMFNISYRF